VNGVELYWEQRGSGPRLLFCNGSGLTLQDVRPLLDPLTASFDLLAWDYRGFGRSAPVTQPYTMADIAADAAGLLEITGWKSCRLMGASFGGMVAQEFAVTHPQRVERLALACTSAGGEGGSSYPLQKLLELPPGQRVAAELKVVDSRWDQRCWTLTLLIGAVAGRMTAAGQDQQDPAAGAAYQAQLQAREGHDVWTGGASLPGPGWLRQLRRDRTGPQQHQHRIAASAAPNCTATKRPRLCSRPAASRHTSYSSSTVEMRRAVRRSIRAKRPAASDFVVVRDAGLAGLLLWPSATTDGRPQPCMITRWPPLLWLQQRSPMTLPH
jgi:pimeloyl-ACP methyl ester carboxylesterase